MQAPPPPPPPARIAYVHAGAVWSMDADGRHRRRLVAHADSPAWSPDGTRLAVRSGSAIVTVPAGGGDRRLVVRARRHEGVANPAWSPDGSRLAFNAFLEGADRYDSTIETVAAAGTGRHVVHAEGFGDEELPVALIGPAFTPDGRALLYTRQTFRGSSVRRVGLDSRGDRRLLAAAANAVFSPDGTRLAFASFRGARGEGCGSDECDPHADLAVAATDGSGRRALLRTTADESDPAWSPDGSRLAFSSARNIPQVDFGDPEIYTVAADGSCLTWLTNSDRASSSPSFSPGSGRTAPARCGGALHRRPRIQRQIPDRLGRALTPGARFRGALLTYARGRGRNALLGYSDCGAFAPARCAPPFLLAQADACRPSQALRFELARMHRVRRVGRVLVAQAHDDRALLFVGRSWSYVQLDARIRRTFSLARAIARRLERVDGMRIGPPHIPAKLRGRVPAGLRSFVRRC